MPRWVAAHPDEKIDVVVVDPPRKGCDEVCLDTIVKMAPERLVILSIVLRTFDFTLPCSFRQTA